MKTFAVPALIWLLENADASANKLARGVQTDPNTATEVAQHLERHGLVEIAWTESQFPGREQMAMRLTPLGDAIAHGLAKIARAEEDKLPEEKRASPKGLPRARPLREGRDLPRRKDR